jgi:hypothetical protein
MGGGKPRIPSRFRSDAWSSTTSTLFWTIVAQQGVNNGKNAGRNIGRSFHCTKNAASTFVDFR